jgi:hypothetical protein
LERQAVKPPPRAIRSVIEIIDGEADRPLTASLAIRDRQIRLNTESPPRPAFSETAWIAVWQARQTFLAKWSFC